MLAILMGQVLVDSIGTSSAANGSLSERPAAITAGKWWRLLTVVVIIGTLAHALTSIALPFGWDHGIMASAASPYAHGGVPYVDSWDMKGPLAYLPYAIVEMLFGRNMWGTRILDLAFVGAGCFFFYRLVGAIADRTTGIVAALALYYWIAAGGFFFTAEPEIWATVLTAVAFGPVLANAEAPDMRKLVLAGLIVGCIGLMKPVYWSFGIAPLLVIALAKGPSLQRRAVLAVALGLSAALPVALTVAWFALKGGLAEAIEVHVFYNMRSYGAMETGVTVRSGFADFLARPVIALLLPFAALGAWNIRTRPSLFWPVVGWIAANLLAVVMQAKFYYYHWLPLYPPLLLLAAIGMASLWRERSGAQAPAFVTVAVTLAFFAQVCAVPFYDVAKAAYYLGLKHSPELYYSSYSYRPGGNVEEQNYNVADEMAAARYIAANSAPDDGLFVWGNNATAEYLADRPNPTRFLMEMPLSVDGPYRPQYRAEAMEGLTANPPLFIIVGINWWTSKSRAEVLGDFPEFKAFLDDNYRYDRSFGAIDLYRRER